MSRSNEQGFTIVELVIVAVLGSLMVAAAYEILRTHQRAYTIQTAQVQAQQSVRAGLDVLTSELREISGSGGDIMTMNASELRVRAMRAFGLICDVDTTGSPITVRKVGRFFSADDSIIAFVDRDPELSSDDTTYLAYVTTIDTVGENCPTGGDTAQTIRSSMLRAAHTAGDTMRPGGPVRAFTHYTYKVISDGGQYYLGREDASGTTAILVGPLSSNGVTFTYYDSSGNTTTTATDVASIGVTITTRSQVTDDRGNLVGDSLQTRVYLRN